MSRGRRDDGSWDLWRVVQRLRPWRRADGPIETEPMVVYKPTRLPHGLWSMIFGLGPAVELIVELDPSNPRYARIVRYLGPRRDRGLTAAQVSWGKTRTLEDPRFGSFSYVERIDTFEGKASWLGQSVILSLDAHNGEPPLGRARALFDHAADWDARLRQAMIDYLLDLKNDNWLGDHEAEFTPDKFLARVTLETISVGAERFYEFYYNDGDLFSGHSIVVTIDGDADHEVTAGIAG